MILWHLLWHLLAHHHHHAHCWSGLVPVKVAKIGGPWHTIWVRETICGDTVTLP